MAAPRSLTVAEFTQVQFDFLIVGGGTAGLAVATRLSQDSGFNVGVLESGSLATGEDEIDNPGLYGQSVGTKHDWQFETVPQPVLGGRSLPWPRGKIVGGTSALNFMIWNRANREDYDAWERLGNSDWGWNNFLPFLKRTETFHPPEPDLQKKYNNYVDVSSVGTSGPIQVSFAKQYSTSHKLWHTTLNSIGVESNKSHFSGSNVGVWSSIRSIRLDQTRSYSANAYYLPNASRPNLFLLTGASVDKVILDHVDDVMTATGVAFTYRNQQYSVSACREVIVSAGTVQSPQILELSGIGNSDLLTKFGIPVKVNNPNVGEHLQDHLMTATIFELNESHRTEDGLKENEQKSASVLEEGKKTPPTTISYLPLSQVLDPESLEDISTLISSLSTSDSKQKANVFRHLDKTQRLGQVEYIFDRGNWNPLFHPDPSNGKEYGTLFQILQYPFSKGSVHIGPAPDGAPTPRADKPVINPQYYEGSHGSVDLEVMARSMRFAEKIYQAKPLANIIRSRVFPPSSTTTDDGYRDWVADTTITDWHPVGTCAMGGVGGIKDGVVDHRLKVFGVQGLRVVDASIIPLHISAHLQATIYGIAEKAAHLILEDHSPTKDTN